MIPQIPRNLLVQRKAVRHYCLALSLPNVYQHVSVCHVLVVLHCEDSRSILEEGILWISREVEFGVGAAAPLINCVVLGHLVHVGIIEGVPLVCVGVWADVRVVMSSFNLPAVYKDGVQMEHIYHFFGENTCRGDVFLLVLRESLRACLTVLA